MTLGEKIQRLRKKKGLTQTEFAEKLGISRTALYNYENNKRTPSTELIVAMADILQVSMDDFLSEILKNKSKNKLTNNIKNKQLNDFADLVTALKAYNIDLRQFNNKFSIIFYDECDECGLCYKALLEKEDLPLLNDILKVSTVNTVKAFIKSRQRNNIQ